MASYQQWQWKWHCLTKSGNICVISANPSGMLFDTGAHRTEGVLCLKSMFWHLFA